MQYISFLNAKDMMFNATRNFHPLRINILLSGNPDLSDQDNLRCCSLIYYEFSTFLDIDFFYLHILFATVLLTFCF